MITVHIPNNHVPERTYIVRTMLSHFCGIETEIVTDKDRKDYELHWGDHSISIADRFFGKFPDGIYYAHTDHLPKKIMQASAVGLDNILILYGDEQLEITRNSIVCHVDLFAGAFFMLTRWEESVNSKKDLHDRFPAEEALTVKEGFILRPIVDEYCHLLKQWLKTLGYLIPEESASYKIVPTCDVDIPFFWSSKPLWKILGGRLRKHFNPLKLISAYGDYRKVKEGIKEDPYDTFDYLMSLAEAHDHPFQFNFIAGGNTRYEGYYAIEDEDIKRLISQANSRGHQIGLHPSYQSYKDADLMKKEKELLQKSTGLTITASRQHFLRFTTPDTWRHLSAAGILEDSTSGYAAEPGFRCGTSRPFPVFDMHQRRELSLIERPLLVMDVSLRFYKKLTIEESIVLCEKIKAEVKKHNGEFVFLWHNSALSEIDGWEEWKEVLEYLMANRS